MAKIQECVRFEFVDLFSDFRYVEFAVEQSDRTPLRATTLEAAVAEMMTELHERADWFWSDDEDEKMWAIRDLTDDEDDERGSIVWHATLRSPLGSMVRP